MNILSLTKYPEEGLLATRLIQGISTEEHEHLIALHKSSEEYLKMRALENQLDQCFDDIPDSSLEEYYRWESAFKQHPAAIKLRELIWSKFKLRPNKWVEDRTNYEKHPSRLPSREVRKRCRRLGECLRPQPLGEAYAAPKLDMAWKMPLEQLCFILDNKETKYKVYFEKHPEMISELEKERNSVAWGQDRHWYNAPLTIQEELGEYLVSTVTIHPQAWFSRYFETAIFKQDRGIPLRVEKSYHLPMAKMMHKQLLEDAQARL